MRKWASTYYANIQTRITASCEKGKHRKVEVAHDAPATRNVFTLSAPFWPWDPRHRRFHLRVMSIFRGSCRLKADFAVFCHPGQT